MGVFRFFHTTVSNPKLATGALAALRKKTGYTFTNCRKALELHNNDIAKAEEWLKEQAKLLGWNAAQKVQTRTATQGLIGVAFNRKKVAMVELNCETDFVSKNSKFKSLVDLVANTCLQYPVLSAGLDTNKISFTSDDLGKLLVNKERLSDHLALLIGSVGENVVLKRAFCYETSRDDIHLAVSVHPPDRGSQILTGKYGSFFAYQQYQPKSPDIPETLEEIGVSLCQHIIGMNPRKIGDYENDVPLKNPDNETVLIHQEYLLNDSKTVGEVLDECGIRVVDFKRFACGESEDEPTEVVSEEQANAEKATA